MTEASTAHRASRSARPRALLAVVAIAVIAILFAAFGIFSRVRAESRLTQTADANALPFVTVAYPVASPPTQEVVLPGTVRAFAETPIYARTSGYLKSWSVDIGGHVKAGQLLATIDTPEVDEQLHQAEADLHTAVANANIARDTARRVAGLVDSQSVSVQENEDRAAAASATGSQVLANEANVSRLRKIVGFQRVVAPYAGVITARETDVGHLVNAGSGAGQELFRMADLSRLRIYVQVPQSYAVEIKAGSTAQLSFPDHPTNSYTAEIVRTAAALDPTSRTLLVELDLPNPKGDLFPGGYAEVHFHFPTPSTTLRVSGNTLLFRSEGPRVAVVDGQGRIALRPVTQGRDFGTSVELLSGVGPHDRVVLNPPAAIASGDKVRVASVAHPKAS